MQVYEGVTVVALPTQALARATRQDGPASALGPLAPGPTLPGPGSHASNAAGVLCLDCLWLGGLVFSQVTLLILRAPGPSRVPPRRP